ncbi:hypothetical protein F5884DRAFT_892974 [Xylogone sp. PMI_703]|nr:hypothetical protein F5884DRAFT_892974 [Xylogone sp. PMI_703]
MPSTDRDPSRDSEQRIRHQSSASSDYGRAIVPMWDSSDPERAPPPLPMNPSSPSITSRPHTSSAIQSAHAALAEKARENSYVVSAISKRIEASPERPLIKNAAHKRMQSLQTGTVREISNLLEGNTDPFSSPSRSPERSPVKPGSPNPSRDIFYDRGSPEKQFTKSGKSTPTNETPPLRPSLRKQPQSILGDNFPPQSATMLALQTMASRDPDPPHADGTNGSNALVRSPMFDAISNQIMSLTNIATSLQKEMAQLSRRSKDNATDLLSLKEATNARDEDIRKSLRELLLNLSESSSRTSSNPYGGGGLLESKPHASPPSAHSMKPFSLPRIPSPRSFAASLDRESLATPSLYSPENTATVALLEKIVREMSTSEGQDLLVSRLSEVAAIVKQDGLSITSKLEELLDYVKSNSSREILPLNGGGAGHGRPRNYSFGHHQPRLELDFESPTSGTVAQRVDALVSAGDRGASIPSNASEIINEDILKIIRSVKDSVAQGGGLTAEVKALVRELRGEVLGMGRELGRKLEELNIDKDTPRDVASEKEEVARIVEEGLSELREHMDQIIRECQNQSSSPTVYRIDYQEIYNAVRTALNDRPADSERPGLEKEDILEAVREAWENYKPEIEVQQFGLEREELLACVKEGIQQYRPQDDTGEVSAASREDVFEAVVEGLKNFSPPSLPTGDNMSRDEIIDAVREVLGEFEFPAAPASEPQITRDHVVDAVKEGLHSFDFAANTTALTRDIGGNVTRDDIFDAVKAGLEGKPVTSDSFNAEVMGRVNEILEVMRKEFKAVSDEAKQNVAAHGRDTEQLLDATKDGFENLRANIESYVDRAVGINNKEEILDSLQQSFDKLQEALTTSMVRSSDIPGKDEILDGHEKVLESLREGFNKLQETMTTSVVRSSDISSKEEILDSIRGEFDKLQETMSSSVVRSGDTTFSKDEILETIRDGFDRLQENMALSVVPAGNTSNKDDILNGMRDNFNRLQETFTSSIRSGEVTDKDEIIADTRAGFDGIRDGFDQLQEALTTTIIHTADVTGKDAVLERMGERFDQLQELMKSSIVESSDSSKDEILSSMRETFEQLQETITTTIVHATNVTGNEKVLESLREGFDRLQGNITSAMAPPEDKGAKDDILAGMSDGFDGVRTGLSQLQETLTTAIVHAADVTGKDTVLGGLQERFDQLQETIKSAMVPSDVSGKDDILAGMRTQFEDLRGGLTELQDALTTTIVHTADVTGRDKILDTMRESFDHLQETLKSSMVPSTDTSGKDDILTSIGDQFTNLRSSLNEVQEALTTTIVHTADITGKDKVLEGMKEGFDQLQETLKSSMVPSGGSTDKEDILAAIRDGFGQLQGSFTSVVENFGDAIGKSEVINGVRDGFDQLQGTVTSTMAKLDDAAGKEDILASIRDGFDQLKETITSTVANPTDTSRNDEILAGMREGFGQIQDILTSKADHTGGKDEILASIREGFDRLHESTSTALVRAGPNADKDEVIDILRDGLSSLREDIQRPRDANESELSVSREILSTLQDSLSALRADVENVGNKPVDMTINLEILNTLKAGLESVRADIDHLRENQGNDRAVTVAASGAVVPADTLKRNDIENLEVLLNDLRLKVEALESMPGTVPAAAGSVSKGDLEGLEILLKDVHETVTAADRDKPEDEDPIKREDVQAIETLLRNTKGKLDELDSEQILKKEHLEPVEAMISSIHNNVTELISNMEQVSKRDELNIVEALVRDIILGLEEMKERALKEANDSEKVTKTDVKAVEAVCLDIKSAIEQTVLSDIAALPSKADIKNLEDQVKEFKDRTESHAEANALAFEERQAETVGVVERVAEVRIFLEEFKDAMREKLEEGATNVDAVSKFLEGLKETVRNSASASDVKELFEMMKAEFEKAGASIEGSKLETDEKFQQTWNKFEAKIDERFNELIAKHDDTQISTEVNAKLAEEKNAETVAAILSTKVVAEDVKTMIDTFQSSFTESIEKMDEASKTVFNRVEDTYAKIETAHSEAKDEHQFTRDEISKTLGAIEGVQDHVNQYHPRMLESIKDILLIVGQHYEHSKSSYAAIEDKIPDVPLLPPPVEKYDDAIVNEKLDKLIEHMNIAGESFAQLDTLDKIHQKVMQTAAEVSDFVSVQKQRIAADHEDKEKAIEEATITLEKRLTEKEHIETYVLALREEEDKLKESVAKLRAEQEELAHTKMRLSADVSSLETALHIRREELQAMEARAEGLERRILEGVIDHSRALLISKANKGRDAMSRKRTPNNSSRTSSAFNAHGALSMAMNGNRAAVGANNTTGSSRRILSLNQITHNVPNGNIKRSHSVKTPAATGPLRKTSLGINDHYGGLDKENLTLKEDEEDDFGGEGADDDRRASYGTTIMTTPVAGESIDEETEWAGSVDGDSITEGGNTAILSSETF